jgi:hypothetical protein
MTYIDSSPVWALPVDPTSPSSMVSATHLVLFRLDSLQTGASTVASDGSISRDLILRVRVEDIFKGRLHETKGSVAALTIHQEGLSPIGEGPPPTLDPDSLISGTSYLLDAVGPADATLADVFAEGSARGVYSADHALDARLAQSAEQRFAQLESDERATIEQLLATAEARRAELHDLFGAYLWLRLTPQLETDRDATMGRLLDLALNEESQSSFVIALLAEFDTFALDLEDEPEVLHHLARTYVASLGQPLPAPVAEYITTQNLYNIVFDEDDQPRVSVSMFGITPSAAADARSTISAIGDEKAKALADWLR